MDELTFSTFDKKPIYIENIYKNLSCFLILSGPSLNNINLSLLNNPGIMTFGVNNSPSIFRPKLWTSVDEPERFMISIWKDPTILKFVPFFKGDKNIFDNYNWVKTNILVKDNPNVIYYHRNEHFIAENYLTEKTVNWGNHKKYGGGRSVLLAAVKICYLLGFRKVFLCGCDFKMEIGKENYAWKQDRTKSAVNCNNNTYNAMINRFTQLRPFFEQNDFFVFNCNKNSGLKVFPFIDFEDAVEMTLKDFPDVKNERVEGMYERLKIEKESKK